MKTFSHLCPGVVFLVAGAFASTAQAAQEYVVHSGIAAAPRPPTWEMALGGVVLLLVIQRMRARRRARGVSCR